MNELLRCPQCDCQLPADAPEGLCPKCLVKAGFESEPAPPREPEPTIRSPLPSAFEPPSIEELACRFPQLEILELLGKGGMGAVYKARQRGLDRLVALKILPPEFGHDESFAERFTREARALAILTHSHIVSIYDFGRNDELFFIVMEFVDGANLRQTMNTGVLTPAEALVIVPQICEALQFAHDEGIVHRDIKPENILIDKRGRVKIADFGLAKLRGTDPDNRRLTGTHQVMGTLRYMAPEQMLGSRTVDHRADIYSLGVVFYELLTGELPMGRFAPPSKRVQVDERLDEIVLHALEQEPKQRYQHASEIKRDVECVSSTPQHVPKSAIAPEPLPTTPSPSQTDKMAAGSALTARDGHLPRVKIAILGAVLLMIIVAPFIKIGSRELALSAISAFSLLILVVLGGVGISIFHEWQNSHSPVARKLLRTVLFVVFACCFVSFFGTAESLSAHGASFTIGIPFPWFESGTGETFRMSINLVSWAWAIFAAGWLSLYALGKSQNYHSAVKDDSNATRIGNSSTNVNKPSTDNFSRD